MNANRFRVSSDSGSSATHLRTATKSTPAITIIAPMRLKGKMIANLVS